MQCRWSENKTLLNTSGSRNDLGQVGTQFGDLLVACFLVPLNIWNLRFSCPRWLVLTNPETLCSACREGALVGEPASSGTSWTPRSPRLLPRTRQCPRWLHNLGGVGELLLITYHPSIRYFLTINGVSVHANVALLKLFRVLCERLQIGWQEFLTHICNQRAE